ncbi:hypothetical protein D8674_027271 [Pyrus ussuriensis x Pyrus communis]|uniref:F-box associated domain-containing protein n=1 Tax=Pyrus ussuriensis x Pyrus communis TaxID=2448454 RepID=A0A5N5IBT4_9ROSA|nr:hypothetical protein D8674_027271 [Pyrus ussuriensis x Pyrus communis]
MKGGHTATKGIRCNTLCQSVGAPSDSDHLSHHSKGSKLSPRWLASGGFLIGLDMFNIDMTASATSRSVNVIDQKHCRFVESGDYYDNDFERTKCLGVCEGRLRMCSLLAHNEAGQVLAVWELKEEEDNGKWCSVHKILFDQMDLAISLDSLQWRNRITPVAVHPNNEDVLPFQVFLPCLPTSIPKPEDHSLTRKKRKLKKKNKVESSTPSGVD